MNEKVFLVISPSIFGIRSNKENGTVTYDISTSAFVWVNFPRRVCVKYRPQFLWYMQMWYHPKSRAKMIWMVRDSQRCVIGMALDPR